MSKFVASRIHFIGVGGASMSALAKFCLLNGISVSGSDASFSSELKKLYLDGAGVFVADYGNNEYDNYVPETKVDLCTANDVLHFDKKSNANGELNAEKCDQKYFFKSIDFFAKFVENADLIVYSSAINELNPELQLAKKLNKPTLERYSFLGEIAAQFDKVIAVGGTHGKTTVTGMISHILKCADKHFTAHIGGNVVGYGNLIVNNPLDYKQNCCATKQTVNQSANELKLDGQSEPVGQTDCNIFVTEACEYKRSLLSLRPTLGVVLNAECDHPDCYPNIEAVNEVFERFLSMSENVLVPLKLSPLCPLRKVLQKNADICKSAHMNNEQIGDTNDGQSGILLSNYNMYQWKTVHKRIDLNALEFYLNGQRLGKIYLSLSGSYNLSNAAFAVAAAMEIGVDFKTAASAVSSFEGVARRYEKTKGVCCKTVIFDYAHHPTQIKSVLESAKREGKLLVVFQPHTYSRTAKYLDDFVSVLGLCETLVIMPTYAAREKTASGVDSAELFASIKRKFSKSKVYLTNSHADTVDFVKTHTKDCDAVLMLGAGNIYDLKGLL